MPKYAAPKAFMADGTADEANVIAAIYDAADYTARQYHQYEFWLSGNLDGAHESGNYASEGNLRRGRWNDSRTLRWFTRRRF